jgi:hypothetical protein
MFIADELQKGRNLSAIILSKARRQRPLAGFHETRRIPSDVNRTKLLSGASPLSPNSVTKGTRLSSR